MTIETVDFGASNEFGAHIFYVEIPRELSKEIKLFEDYGFYTDKRETTECRVSLSRKVWVKIKDVVKDDFNKRLKENNVTRGKWKSGKVKLDRILGKEICVLLWALEHAELSECDLICDSWLALRPEERWWLYSKTFSNSGLHNQTNMKWRKLLYCMLSDGERLDIIDTQLTQVI